MQRYFVNTEQIKDQIVHIIGDDVKHIIKVMRMSIGDEIICADGQSQTVQCEIIEMTNEEVTAKIIKKLEPKTELPIHITIAQALPKGDKFEWIVQKGTELGASSFIPYQANRSITKWDAKKSVKKIERLEKIAKEAAEQSYRERIPTVQDYRTFSEMIKYQSDYTKVIIAYEEIAKTNEHSRFRETVTSLKEGDSLLIIIGPEGGFTTDEVNACIEKGAVSCSFGPRILRTETAALYALASISYEFEC